MADKKDVFRKRLEENYEELRALYFSLYHDEIAFRYFLGLLEQAYRARKTALRRRDSAAVKNPGRIFSQNFLGMMMYTENFAGTLNGVLEKLPYLKECGVNYLHLMPLLDSPADKSDGGYAVSDYRKVRPDLGTMEDLEALTDACHKKGTMVCLDFVMNHTSEEHEWAKAARKGDPVAQARYFFYDDWTIPDQFQKTLPEVFPSTAPGNYTWLDDCKKIVMTSFYPFQWDLNYANPMVFNDMTDNLLYLANRGIDIVRLDAVPYIWKTLGTNCRNLPEVHTLVRMMNLACSIVCPSVMLLGEVVMEPREVMPYFGSPGKPECDMLYNVTTMCTVWNTLATGDVRLLYHQIRQIEQLPSGCLFQNYIRCHDDIGWGLDYRFLEQFGMREAPHKKYLNDWFTGKWPGARSRGELYNDFEALQDARLCGTTASLCGIETALYEKNESALRTGIAADLMLHALIFTLSGIPVLYSGDEIGMLNDYDYHYDPEKSADSRFIHRGVFDWDLAETRHQPGTYAASVFHGLSALAAVRKASELFRADASMYAVETGNDHVLGIGRAYGNQKLLALFNFAPENSTVQLDSASWKDLMEKDREFTQQLEPYGFRWLVRSSG